MTGNSTGTGKTLAGKDNTNKRITITYIGNTDEKGNLTTIIKQMSYGAIKETLVVQSETENKTTYTVETMNPITRGKTQTLQVIKRTQGAIKVARVILTPGRAPVTRIFVIELRKPAKSKG